MTDKKPKSADYLKYSGLAFQMFFVLVIGWLIGEQIDKYLGFKEPVAALTLLILFLVAFFYKLIRDLSDN